MAIPKYNELYRPLLTVLEDGALHSMKDVRDSIAQMLHLTEQDLSETLTNGSTIYAGRVGWAKTYLKKAELIESPQRGYIKITPSGQKVLADKEPITNHLLAQQCPAFLEFYQPKNADNASASPSPADATNDPPETPQETFDRVYSLINDQLADDLLTSVLSQSPAFFEQLVVDLMKAMDYGDGFVTKYSGDDGIDGIIHEDKLGFNLIYIQAKRWKPDITIGKPELQKFAGAMMGPPRVEKGLFITTAKFSPKAKEYATAQHIIYLIKRTDSDDFSDND